LPIAAERRYITCMSQGPDISALQRRLADFTPDRFPVTRALAYYSAAIAVADDDLMSAAIDRGKDVGVVRDEFYEIVLQSYLFLGFPRMLQAALHLDRLIPNRSRPTGTALPGGGDTQVWYDHGLQLCRRVYEDAFESLRGKVEPTAPEVFTWMIVEGYGKVLSRPGLEIVDRELSIVAFLMAENRPVQLYSHMRGALNVGAGRERLQSVVEDLGPAVGDGYGAARSCLERLGAF